jgi:hypothetical protein
MSVPSIGGGFEAVNRTVAPIFTNTSNTDLAIYTETSNQSVHIGVGMDNTRSSGVIVTSSNIVFNNTIMAVTGTSSNAPSYSWNGDSNTGMYRVAEDTIGFSCGGTNIMTACNTGIQISGAVDSSTLRQGGTNVSLVGHTHSAADITSGTLSTARLPFKLDSGFVSTSTQSGTVNFTTSFASPPNVCATLLYTGTANLVIVRTSNITASSFQYTKDAINSGNATVVAASTDDFHWIAVGV